jgi:hypothetical protein
LDKRARVGLGDIEGIGRLLWTVWTIIMDSAGLWWTCGLLLYIIMDYMDYYYGLLYPIIMYYMSYYEVYGICTVYAFRLLIYII